MKLSHLVATAAFVGMTSLVTVAQAAPSSRDFVAKASEAGTFEVESSKLALQKSSNDNVKQFAQEMIDDHTKASDELNTALETAKTKAEPTEELNSDHAKTMKKLQSASGADFDKKYVSAQTDAHKDAVKLFSSYSKKGDDASLKQFATATLPTLQTHLAHVKELKSNL